MLRGRLVGSLAALTAAASLAVSAPAAADPRDWMLGPDPVFVRQHERFVRIDSPDAHLTRARESYVQGQRGIAADELERAAAGFAFFADRAAGAQRDRLERAQRGLTKLADDVRANRVGEVTVLDRALADARSNLAGFPPTAKDGR